MSAKTTKQDDEHVPSPSEAVISPNPTQDRDESKETDRGKEKGKGRENENENPLSLPTNLEERYAQRHEFKDAEAAWRRTAENMNEGGEDKIQGPSVEELERNAEKKAAEMKKDARERESLINDIEAQQDLQQKLDERHRRPSAIEGSKKKESNTGREEDKKSEEKKIQNIQEERQSHSEDTTATQLNLKEEDKASYQADKFLAEVSKDLQENYKQNLEEQRAAEGIIANAKHRVMDVVDQVINVVEDAAEYVFGGGEEDISKTDMQKKAERKVDRHAFVGAAKRSVKETLHNAKEKATKDEETS